MYRRYGAGATSLGGWCPSEVPPDLTIPARWQIPVRIDMSRVVARREHTSAALYISAREGCGLADRSGLIHWRCDAAGHQQAPDGRTADTLTVHDGKWAYCPGDVAAKDHVWTATGGVQIEMLRRGSPTISLDLDMRPVTPTGTAAASRKAAARSGGTPTARKRATPQG